MCQQCNFTRKPNEQRIALAPTQRGFERGEFTDADAGREGLSLEIRAVIDDLTGKVSETHYFVNGTKASKAEYLKAGESVGGFMKREALTYHFVHYKAWVKARYKGTELPLNDICNTEIIEHSPIYTPEDFKAFKEIVRGIAIDRIKAELREVSQEVEVQGFEIINYSPLPQKPVW